MARLIRREVAYGEIRIKDENQRGNVKSPVHHQPGFGTAEDRPTISLNLRVGARDVPDSDFIDHPLEGSTAAEIRRIRGAYTVVNCIHRSFPWRLAVTA